MRNNTDNTRRIGGLMLDLLMLSFIISLSLADVKIAEGNTGVLLTVKTTPDGHIIVSNFDSLFGSLLKQVSKFQPNPLQSLGVIFEFPRTAEFKRIVLANRQCLYRPIFTDTKINAP